MINKFQDFQVWQKAHALTKNIYQITKPFPKDELFGLISQIRRSSVSICANIAEGYTKSNRDFIRYLDISRASLEETKYYLILSKDLNYLNLQQFNDFYNHCEEVGKMLFGLKSKLIQFRQSE